MSSERVEHTQWLQLPIVCPHCGNHGERNRNWEKNGWTPFRLIEEVIRSWEFSAAVDGQGKLSLIADTNSDEVNWESGSNLRLECVECFNEFPVPEDAHVDFDD